MTPLQFTAWRERLNLSRIEAARLLGVHRDTVLKWENGVNPIPKMADMACKLAEVNYRKQFKPVPWTWNVPNPPKST